MPVRVVLVSANREHFPEPVFPLGAAYVAGALLRRGASVRIFDAGLHLFPLHALRRELRGFKPDVIGLSLRNIDNAAYPCTRSYVPGYIKIVETIRSLCTTPVILGGSACSIFPEELMKVLKADGGIAGEGEGGAAHFWRMDRKVYRTERRNLRDIGFPRNLEEIFPLFHRYRTIGIQTARGCPHRCIYCTYPSLEGPGVRTRPPDAVVEDLDLLCRRFGKRDFFIVNSSFNADEAHMAEVLEKILARGLNISFSCYLQPKMRDLSLFGLLKRAGCVAVDFGTDSGSEAMAATMGKGFTIDDVRSVSHACRHAGIDVCHSLIFGGPGETAGTIRETIRLMDELSPKAVVAMTGIRVYPGTGIERRAQKEGQVVPGDSLLRPRFYFSELGQQVLIKEVFEGTRGRRNWFFPGERDWSSAPGPHILRLFHREGPLWRTFK